MSGTGLKLDYAHMMADIIGNENGVETAELDRFLKKGVRAVGTLRDLVKAGKLGFAKLPFDKQLPDDLKSLGDRIAAEVDNFVVLGIGGSALGSTALHMALHHPYYNLLPRDRRGDRPRIFVIDNPDPELAAGVLENLNLNRTAVNIISKSGGTTETMALAMLFLKEMEGKIGREKMRERVIATTDPGRGALRALAEREGYRTLEVPPDVGGRFSVLSAVGLLSAAVSGVDIAAVIDGARIMNEACFEPDVASNPALAAAVLKSIAYFSKGKSITVMMPYSNALVGIADWFKQLWAESLGKRVDRSGKVINIGQTPIEALGATDQHSQVQLYMEGPYDKLITFLAVKEYRERVSIPDIGFDDEAISYLSGKTLNDLIKAEQRAMALALAQAGRPNMTIELDEISERTVGMILYMLEVQTAITGEIFKVDTFNQPGVEKGKKLTYAMMRRKGYERLGEEITEAVKRTSGRYEIVV